MSHKIKHVNPRPGPPRHQRGSIAESKKRVTDQTACNLAGKKSSPVFAHLFSVSVRNIGFTCFGIEFWDLFPFEFPPFVFACFDNSQIYLRDQISIWDRDKLNCEEVAGRFGNKFDEEELEFPVSGNR